MTAEEFAEKLEKGLKLQNVHFKGDNLMASCPNPDHPDNKPSFGYNLVTHFYNCWGCGLKGRGLVSLYYKLEKKVPDWAREAKLKIKPQRKIHSMGKEEAFEVSQDYIELVTQNNKAAQEKLLERGVPKAITKKFQIGYNPKKDVLFFPCFGKDGKLRGWTQRSDNYPSRYKIQPDGISKGEMLFGEQHIPYGKNNVYLVEGPVDALKMWGWGFKAVSVFGSELLERQLEQLQDIANYVIHIPDNDSAGTKFRQSAALKMIGKLKFSQVRLPKGVKDIGADNCTKEVILEAIENRREVNRSNVSDK